MDHYLLIPKATHHIWSQIIPNVQIPLEILATFIYKSLFRYVTMLQDNAPAVYANIAPK